jgi:hypothetical protein
MQTAEYNHNDFSNTAEADKALMVKFFYKNVENKMESQAQGRPVFKEKTYIEIRIAGQRDAQACRPVTHSDKQRFPAHYEAFEKRMEPPADGMPLLEWSLITRSQAEELSFLHIKTVEQLAMVKDGNIQNFMGGYALREKAVKWLETSSAETVDREKEEMREQLKVQAEQIASLQKMMDLKPKVAIDLESTKDITDTAPVEGAAIPVPPAPAGKKRAGRARK